MNYLSNIYYHLLEKYLKIEKKYLKNHFDKHFIYTLITYLIDIILISIFVKMQLLIYL